MQSPSGNRRGYAVLALCLGLVILAQGAGALRAEYWIAQNGTAAYAVVETGPTDEYAFTESGILGERIPLQTGNISLANDTCAMCEYEQETPYQIRFPPGNYTVSYTMQVRDRHLLAVYGQPYDVSVHLAEGFDVRNPLLGSISRGAEVSAGDDGTVTIAWNQARFAECRFYDATQETLLLIFGTLWGACVVVLLFAVLMMRKTGKNHD